MDAGGCGGFRISGPRGPRPTGLVGLGVVDELVADDHHVVGGLDPQADLVAVDFDDLDPDVGADLNPLELLAAQDEHPFPP